MRLIFLLVLFGRLLGHSYAFGFARPAWVVPQRSGSYGGNMVWNVGDVQTVDFDCPWPEYKIELWQQSLVVAGAVVAKKPVYQRKSLRQRPCHCCCTDQIVGPETLGQVLPQQFNWTVNKYQFDLQDSPVFFFWLKEVSDAKNPAAQTSAFFNMTERPEEASTSTSLPSSTTSVSTTSIPSNVAIAEPTAADEKAPAATQGQQSAEQTPGGLSTGATAGIAAAVGVAAIAATSCVIFLFLRRKKRPKQQRWPEQQQPPSSYYPSQYGTANGTYLYDPPKQHPQPVVVPTVQEFPNNPMQTSELPGDNQPPVAPHSDTIGRS